MKLNRVLWQMRNDFQGEYKCEFCGAIETDESADSYMDAYYFENVIPNMFCKKCGKNSNGKVKEN
jgi:C4-type Zn-finger protein